jgi:hypothetical protein
MRATVACKSTTPTQCIEHCPSRTILCERQAPMQQLPCRYFRPSGCRPLCPAGTWSEHGIDSPGTFSKTSVAPCAPCPAGQVANKTGQTKCTPCDEGSYAPAAGSSSCTLCRQSHCSDVIGASNPEVCKRAALQASGRLQASEHAEL